MLLDEQPSPEQFARLQSMSGQQRLRLAEQLYWSARKMKAAGLRLQHPEWGSERIEAELREVFLHART
jgi:hypothetical protein